METFKDVVDFVFDAIDLPLQLEETRQKNFRAQKCLNKYKQTGIVPDDRIREAQNKEDKILYIEDYKKDNPHSYWDMSKKLFDLADIVADLNGCTSIK